MVFYWTNTGKKINARIEQKSPNILHLSIENTELNREGLLRLKLGSIILIMYACLIWTFERSCNVMWAHGFFALLLLIISLSCIKIVRGERLVLVKDFALQYSTHFMTGGTKTELIPIKHIHDVVINEIFCNLKVVFVLSVQTKGTFFKKKPVITLLNNLNPRLDCLEMIYNEIHSILDLQND
ncbi:uncharacterized protein LOC128741281 isoform X1 [Sabethes cyaneus]|uniref:uncharacterized protein LOC128741281 isoform X1 n=1 Tax=Sabethes cyaneus TaxID=53552 RepID=UPI00237EE181|nr:uncharacterized protein LOC128741281 isoform X1 [Sabethes cyaneus]XP_053692968.1 uncharacterized protein LOC128741281 isoform X1 [Sabethes cyaneus]